MLSPTRAIRPRRAASCAAVQPSILSGPSFARRFAVTSSTARERGCQLRSAETAPPPRAATINLACVELRDRVGQRGQPVVREVERREPIASPSSGGRFEAVRRELASARKSRASATTGHSVSAFARRSSARRWRPGAALPRRSSCASERACRPRTTSQRDAHAVAAEVELVREVGGRCWAGTCAACCPRAEHLFRRVGGNERSRVRRASSGPPSRERARLRARPDARAASDGERAKS